MNAAITSRTSETGTTRRAGPGRELIAFHARHFDLRAAAGSELFDPFLVYGFTTRFLSRSPSSFRLSSLYLSRSTTSDCPMIGPFGLVEHEPRAKSSRCRWSFKNPIAFVCQVDRQVEVTGLRIGGGKRIEELRTLPLCNSQARDADFDRVLTVTVLCFGTRCHDQCEVVVRFGVIGIEPQCFNVPTRCGVELTLAGEGDPQVVVRLAIVGIEPQRQGEMRLSGLELPWWLRATPTLLCAAI